jgi:hypothetical protein
MNDSQFAEIFNCLCRAVQTARQTKDAAEKAAMVARENLELAEKALSSFVDVEKQKQQAGGVR